MLLGCLWWSLWCLCVCPVRPCSRLCNGRYRASSGSVQLVGEEPPSPDGCGSSGSKVSGPYLRVCLPLTPALGGRGAGVTSHLPLLSSSTPYRSCPPSTGAATGYTTTPPVSWANHHAVLLLLLFPSAVGNSSSRVGVSVGRPARESGMNSLT